MCDASRGGTFRLKQRSEEERVVGEVEGADLAVHAEGGEMKWSVFEFETEVWIQPIATLIRFCYFDAAVDFREPTGFGQADRFRLVHERARQFGNQWRFCVGIGFCMVGVGNV